MGIFGKTKRSRMYDHDTFDKNIYDEDEDNDEDDESDSDNLEKNSRIMELYDAFERVEEEKQRNRKVEGEPDYETRKKQQLSKMEEEKYDHLLNSMQAQTLIQAVEKYGSEETNSQSNIKPKVDEFKRDKKLDKVNTRIFGAHDIELFVKEQCDIMEEAAVHVENAKAEYEAVTEEFNDIQLIEEAPEDIRKSITAAAELIDNTMVDRRILKSSEHKLSNSAYRRMEAVEDELPRGIKFLKAQEEYYDTVKRDMRILEGERMNLRMEANSLVKKQLKIRKLAKTAIVALIAVFAIFLISISITENDSDMALFIGVSLFAAILAVGMFAVLKITERNVLVTEIKLNKAISLLNKVKIKYINAANTLDYEYTKYGVKSAYELENKYQLYNEMKKEQMQMLDMTSALNSAEFELENQLKKLGMYDPHIWIGRVKALVNPKEMVEVRHELNTRRYKLRQQIEYNENRIAEAKNTIRNVTLSNPEYSEDAMRVIELYEKRHSRVAK